LVDELFICIDEVNFMNNERDTYNRYDPDSTLYGFCPFWGVLLLILSGIFSPGINISIFVYLAFFLAIAGLSLIGYLIGWRTPVQSHHPSTDSTIPFFVIQNFTKAI